MKKIASFILIIFTLVQATPALEHLFHNSSDIVFSIDEENSADKKVSADKKEIKDYQLIAYSVKIESLKTTVAFHEAEKIQAPPCLEKLIPPPNTGI
jgi:hypothetical protein